MKKTTLSLFFAFSFLQFMAQSPIGIWKTIDDETQKEKSYIQIYEEGGKLYGKIIKLLGGAKNNICEICEGKYKNKSLEGLVILKNMSSKNNAFEGGTIYDPKSNKEYKCNLQLESKNKLKVRGFIGFSLIGRTQYWYRVE